MARDDVHACVGQGAARERERRQLECSSRPARADRVQLECISILQTACKLSTRALNRFPRRLCRGAPSPRLSDSETTVRRALLVSPRCSSGQATLSRTDSQVMVSDRTLGGEFPPARPSFLASSSRPDLLGPQALDCSSSSRPLPTTPSGPSSPCAKLYPPPLGSAAHTTLTALPVLLVSLRPVRSSPPRDRPALCCSPSSPPPPPSSASSPSRASGPSASPPSSSSPASRSSPP